MRLVRFVLVAIIIAANAGAFAAWGSAAQGRIGGEAYGLAVGPPALPVAGSPYVELPAEGGAVSQSSPGAGLGTGNIVGNADQLAATSTGSLIGGDGSVTSTASISSVELFAGLIRAQDVRVTATSTLSGGRATSSGSVIFGTLTVAGLAYPNPAPNLRVELPGLGYVVLNEQLVGGDGQTSSSIIVRAMRLQVTEPSVLNVPQYTEFIVAHASSGVPEISASRPVAAGPPPPPTRVAWAPISTREPIDLSLDEGDEDDNDNFDFDDEDEDEDDDNDNARGVTAAGATGATGGAGASGGASAAAPVIVTVVVAVTPVVVTSTPGPTKTPTKTPTPSPDNDNDDNENT